MIPGHAHTVRSSPIPLYMRGWHLGQDDGSGIDETLFLDTGIQAPVVDAGTMDPTMYDPSTGLIAPTSSLSAQDQALAQLYQSSVAAGTMTPAQASSAIAQLITGGAAVAKAATGVSTAPSPRVAAPAVPGKTSSILTSETIVPGIPDLLFVVLGGLVVMEMGSR